MMTRSSAEPLDEPSTIGLLSAPQVRLAFDTNAIFGLKNLLTLCDELERIRDKLNNQIILCMSAIVLAEKIFDLQQKLRERFDYVDFKTSLQDRRIELLSFGEEDALGFGTLMFDLCPDDASWRTLKWQHYLRIVGSHLAGGNPQSDPSLSPPPKNKNLPATIDWLIAAHAQERGCILVTNDKGSEFRHVQHVQFEILKKAAASILQCPQPASGGQS